MKKIYKIKNFLFFAALAALAIVGLLWFLRPQVSELEKRELTKFPKLTLAGIMDGSFGTELDKWYADTYPLRDSFIGGANRLKALYGNRSVQIIPGAPQGGTATGSDEGSGGTDDTVPSTDDATPPEGGTQGDAQDGSAGTTPDDGNASTTPPTGLDEEEDDTPMAGEVSGPVFVSGDSAYGLSYFNQTSSDAYARIVNRAQRLLSGEAQVYSIIIPTSSGILLNSATQKDIGVDDQRETIEYVNGQLTDDVRALNIYDTMKAHDGEYIYFRTDHHWTALGAYYAYTDFCEAKGVTPHELSQFTKREYPGFLGSFYSRAMSSAMERNPDTVEAYVPMGTNNMVFIDAKGVETNWYIISDVTNSFSGGKYYCFAGSDQPYAYAHNPQITDGSACVVVKDSFGNAFVPFLVDHYEYTYWIDFRYYKGTLPGLVREKGIGDVIFCFNTDNISSSSVASMLDQLVPEG